jgi:hypothetical protein
MAKIGKIVYVPPEKCFSRVKIEETPHGYKLYRVGEDRPFMSLPFSCVKVIEWRDKNE